MLPTSSPSHPSVTWGHTVTTCGDMGVCPNSPWTLLTQSHLAGPTLVLAGCDGLHGHLLAQTCQSTSQPPSATRLCSRGLPGPQAEEELI